MTFVTTAGEIQAACKAGLVLIEPDGTRPQYIGTKDKWELYTKLITEN